MPRIDLKDLPPHLRARAMAQINPKPVAGSVPPEPDVVPAPSKFPTGKIAGPAPWGGGLLKYDSKAEAARAGFWSMLAPVKEYLWFPHLALMLPCGRYTADFVVINPKTGKILIEDVKRQSKSARKTETNRALRSIASAYPIITVRLAFFMPGGQWDYVYVNQTEEWE